MIMCKQTKAQEILVNLTRIFAYVLNNIQWNVVKHTIWIKILKNCHGKAATDPTCVEMVCKWALFCLHCPPWN